MGDLEVDIYMSNLIHFFENNENDLITLVGQVQKQKFYDYLREECENNIKEGKEVSLTREQITDVILRLKIGKLEPSEADLSKIIQKTKFGDIILN